MLQTRKKSTKDIIKIRECLVAMPDFLSRSMDKKELVLELKGELGSFTMSTYIAMQELY
jgi:hypothetical protein